MEPAPRRARRRYGPICSSSATGIAFPAGDGGETSTRSRALRLVVERLAQPLECLPEEIPGGVRVFQSRERRDVGEGPALVGVQLDDEALVRGERRDGVLEALRRLAARRRDAR